MLSCTMCLSWSICVSSFLICIHSCLSLILISISKKILICFAVAQWVSGCLICHHLRRLKVSCKLPFFISGNLLTHRLILSIIHNIKTQAFLNSRLPGLKFTVRLFIKIIGYELPLFLKLTLSLLFGSSSGT